MKAALEEDRAVQLSVTSMPRMPWRRLAHGGPPMGRSNLKITGGAVIMFPVFKNIYSHFMGACMCLGLCAPCVCGAQEGQKRTWDPLGLELLVAVSYLMWVL